jgi:hypothetical protein
MAIGLSEESTRQMSPYDSYQNRLRLTWQSVSQLYTTSTCEFSCSCFKPPPNRYQSVGVISMVNNLSIRCTSNAKIPPCHYYTNSYALLHLVDALGGHASFHRETAGRFPSWTICFVLPLIYLLDI